MSTAEWEVRVELAACYRLTAHFRKSDLNNKHISARVPGANEHFLINAYGLMFDEITASTLVKVTLAGEIVDDPTGLGVNPAGYVIHSAIHGARHDVGCVMHTHTAAGLAVAAQRQGLLPLTQHAMRFSNCLSYHDYEGIALDMDEQQRLVRDLSTNNAMISAQPRLARLRRERGRGIRRDVLPRARLPSASGRDEWRRRAQHPTARGCRESGTAIHASRPHCSHQRMGGAEAHARSPRPIL